MMPVYNVRDSNIALLGSDVSFGSALLTFCLLIACTARKTRPRTRWRQRISLGESWCQTWFSDLEGREVRDRRL